MNEYAAILYSITIIIIIIIVYIRQMQRLVYIFGIAFQQTSK